MPLQDRRETEAFDAFMIQEVLPTGALALMLGALTVAPMLAAFGVIGLIVLFPVLPRWGQLTLALPALPLVGALLTGLACGWRAYDTAQHTYELPEWNLDPETRITPPRAGCMFGASAVEYLLVDARLTSSRLLAVVLGPPNGAYLGPYPTSHEADLLLGAGTKVDDLDAFVDGVEVDGELVRLPSDLVANVTGFILPWKLRAKLVGDTLIVGTPGRTVLIDTTTNTPFATYPEYR